jgi:hypothetical protein
MQTTIDSSAEEIAVGGDEPLRRPGGGALQELVVVGVSAPPDSPRGRHEPRPSTEQGDQRGAATSHGAGASGRLGGCDTRQGAAK